MRTDVVERLKEERERMNAKKETIHDGDRSRNVVSAVKTERLREIERISKSKRRRRRYGAYSVPLSNVNAKLFSLANLNEFFSERRSNQMYTFGVGFQNVDSSKLIVFEKRKLLFCYNDEFE
ncbi:Hypothetical protein CINCED_3A003362 [Cinara cedri]|uniref:Uncharacterized protein n=1 Tax=Cinara cedri TaxID=506608 RepID=A0A5E4MHG7_9HEMI|nr:Hypothetical protein CINCED_3A003362 [Cinara cedri]